MVKFILDLSFVIKYADVDTFYSDENNSKFLDKALPEFTSGNPMFIIPLEVIEEAKCIFPERILVLDSLFGLCEKSDIKGADKIDTLIKVCAVYEVVDAKTYVLANDEFIINSISTTTHKAVNIKQAKEILGISE